MTDSESDKPAIGRRRFLKSLFGLGAVHEAEQAAIARPRQQNASFFWTNLHTGHVGFPTGMNVPFGLPGSVMKLVSAAALRETGHFTTDEKIECRGSVRINNENYSCLYPHGFVDLTHAIGLSCNVFFATASQKLSPAILIDFTHKFGLDVAAAGYPPHASPKRPIADAAHYALGLSNDLQPNALQIMRIASLIALKGTIHKLHDPGNFEEQDHGAEVQLQLEPSTWMVLQQGMRMCGREGTAKGLDPEDKLKLAVKTGTAPHGTTFQSWITGYFPYDNPKTAFCLRAPVGTSQERAVPEVKKWLFSTEWP